MAKQEPANFFNTLRNAANANRDIQPNERLDSEGLRICPVCGERKETRLDLSKIKASGLFSKRPVVPCMCRCEREQMQKEKEEEQKKEKMARLNELRKASLIDSRFKEARFESFRTTKDNQIIYKRCHKYAVSFNEMVEKNCGLLFWGDVGTGKSYAAACIANHLLDKGVPVIMTSFVKLLDICGRSDETDIINRLTSAQLVIFDDLGAERGTDYALERVYNIVDSRYRSKLPMIMTTNLTLDEMMQETDLRYSRIYDRIFEICYPMQFTGVSWRKREAYKRVEEFGAFLDKENSDE